MKLADLTQNATPFIISEKKECNSADQAGI